MFNKGDKDPLAETSWHHRLSILVYLSVITNICRPPAVVKKKLGGGALSDVLQLPGWRGNRGNGLS